MMPSLGMVEIEILVICGTGAGGYVLVVQDTETVEGVVYPPARVADLAIRIV